MSDIGITYRGMVHQWHCDHMGHMNVMWYVGKFDEATWNLGATMGMTAQYLREAKRGMAAVDSASAIGARRWWATSSWSARPAGARPKSVRFVHEMFRGDGGDHLSTMMVTGVHIDIAARKSTQFDPQIFAKSQAMVDPHPARWDEWPPAGLSRLDHAKKKPRTRLDRARRGCGLAGPYPPRTSQLPAHAERELATDQCLAEIGQRRAASAKA